jgi:uncharacterized lipoprotein YddW (UPF0748 family)
MDTTRRRVTLAALGGGLAGGLGSALMAGCAGPAPAPPAPPTPPSPPQALRADELPPPAPREFRGAWIASVAHIDWPSRPGLDGAAQRAEALAVLERARALGLNALVLQVRPAADALYASSLEPWSEYLTGAQGRAPDPAWDPLAFWVSEAHRRGLELHAWFNPYRARHSSAKSALSPRHLARTDPAVVKTYGDLLWMDPGERIAAQRTLDVVADVVWRYDIDGVHIDDYFYPYPLALPGGGEQPFPDEPSWRRYREAGGTLSREDWRRDNVNRLVEALHQRVHSLKPGLRLGISPFGLGKPALRPPGIQGFSQYDKLYADVELWLHKGWLDYLAPQLYWPIDRNAQAFDVLLDYWLAQNRAGRHVWPGLYTSMVTGGTRPGPVGGTGPGPAGSNRQWPAGEVIEQIEHLRQRPGAGGHIHFSMAALMQDRDGVATRLRAGPYASAALVPATPWLPGSAPAAPQLRSEGSACRIEPAAGPPAFVWAVWRRRAGAWQFAVQPAAATLLATADNDALVVSAVDRQGVEGPRTALRPKP